MSRSRRSVALAGTKEGFFLQAKAVLKVILEPMSGADGVNLKRLEPGSDVSLVYGGNVGEAIQKTASEENN